MALVSSFLIGEPSDMAGKWAHTSGGRPLHLEIAAAKANLYVKRLPQIPVFSHRARKNTGRTCNGDGEG